MLTATCTLVSAAKSGVAIQSWFGCWDLLSAVRRWRQLTDDGVGVGLWLVEQKTVNGAHFTYGEYADIVHNGPSGFRQGRGGRYWVVGVEPPSPRVYRQISYHLGPEVA